MHHTSPRHLAVRIEVAPAYELILSMGAAVAPTPPVGFAVPSALLERASQFAQSDWMWAHLITLAAEAPAPRDAAALLSYLERVSAAELQRRLIGFYVPWFRARTSPARMDAAIRGDRVAARELLDESFPDDPAWQASLRFSPRAPFYARISAKMDASFSGRFDVTQVYPTLGPTPGCRRKAPLRLRALPATIGQNLHADTAPSLGTAAATKYPSSDRESSKNPPAPA